MENLTEAAKKALVSQTQPENVHESASGFYHLYEQSIRKAIDNGIKEIPGDFYILGIVYKDQMDKTERTIQIRARACVSCPNPTWLQNVYKYRRASDDIELLWSIPAASVCQYYEQNKHYVPPSEYCILKNVLDFHSGACDLICARENALIDPMKVASYVIGEK